MRLDHSFLIVILIVIILENHFLGYRLRLRIRLRARNWSQSAYSANPKYKIFCI